MAATGVVSPSPHHHQIKERPPPLSRCAFTFSVPTPSHHHHALYSRLPTTPKYHSSSSSSDSMASTGASPSPRTKTEKNMLSSSTTAGTSHANYLKLIERAVDAGDYDKAFHFLERLVYAGYRPEVIPCTKLIQGFSSLHYDKIRKAERVMEILELHGSPDTVAYSALITALCRCNKVDTALSVLPRMRRYRCQPNIFTYNILVRELCLGGHLDDAIGLFRRMVEGDLCQPCVVTYTILIEAQISEGAVADAVRLLEDMFSRGLSPDGHTYRAIIRGLCREGLIDEAWQLVRQQQPSRSAPASAFPDVTSYNVLLRALLSRKRWVDAGALVTEMLASRRLEPSMFTYGILVVSFCQEGMLVNTVSLLDDMVRQGLRPDSHCIDPVICAYCKQGRVDLAVAFLLRMLAAGCMPNMVNYNNILLGLCRSGKAQDAARLLLELERTGRKPNTTSYKMVVGGLWAGGEMQMVVELVGEMLAKRLVADEVMYDMLVSYLCMDGMVDEAMELVRMMEVAGLRPTAITYNAVLLGLCKMGKVVEAIDVYLCEMMRMGTSNRRKSGGDPGTGRITRPNNYTYEILVEGIAFRGHRAEATELANVLIAFNMISKKSKKRIRMRRGHWHQRKEERWW